MRGRRSVLSPPIIALTLLAAACASGGQNEPAREAGSPNVITEEQVRTARGGSAYDVVRQVRSRWLLATNRGEVWVYFDNRRMGDIESLRGIAASDVGSMEFFPFAEAIGRYPEFSSGAGVIQVHSRRN